MPEKKQSKAEKPKEEGGRKEWELGKRFCRRKGAFSRTQSLRNFHSKQLPSNCVVL